jgi:lysozyme family protein
MSLYEPAVEYVLEREKGLNENKDGRDPGGITNMGVSLRTLKEVPVERLRTYGIPIYVDADTIRDLTVAQVKAFYRGEFWDHAPFYAINNQDVANYLFDACVNMDIAPGIKCLQRAIWALERDRSVILDDGILGLKTLEFVNGQNQFALLSAMRSERAGSYRVDAILKPQENIDLDGWLNRSYNKST